MKKMSKYVFFALLLAAALLISNSAALANPSALVDEWRITGGARLTIVNGVETGRAPIDGPLSMSDLDIHSVRPNGDGTYDITFSTYPIAFGLGVFSYEMEGISNQTIRMRHDPATRTFYGGQPIRHIFQSDDGITVNWYRPFMDQADGSTFWLSTMYVPWNYDYGGGGGCNAGLGGTLVLALALWAARRRKRG